MVENLMNLPDTYKEDIEKAVKILKEHGAKEVFIFGSIANGTFTENSDIEIVVKGLKAKLFYRIASILMFELENEFDLIDLEGQFFSKLWSWLI